MMGMFPFAKLFRFIIRNWRLNKNVKCSSIDELQHQGISEWSPRREGTALVSPAGGAK